MKVKMIRVLGLLALTLSMGWTGSSSGDAKLWLVKCVPDRAGLEQSALALKAKGVNVLATALESGRFRDDLCGLKVGKMGAVYLRESQAVVAKNADALLKSAPEGYPPANRKTH